MASRSNLEKLLAKTFNAYQEPADRAVHVRNKKDFIFHMTDWISDLERLARVYEHPQEENGKDAKDAIFGFLVHALPHLNAASRLLIDKVLDPFSGTTARLVEAPKRRSKPRATLVKR